MIEFFYKKYKQLMMHIAYRILWDFELSEDAVQDAFIKIIKNREKMQDYESIRVKNTLCIIIKNTAIDILRKKKNEISIEECPELISAADLHEQVEQRVEIHEILTFLKTLPAEDGKALILNLFYGYAPKEIAPYMNWSESKTRKRLQRVKGKIRKNLKNDY